MSTPLACKSWSEAVAASLSPSFTRMCRSSEVDKQVPIIEQCRWVAKSQILRLAEAAESISHIFGEISAAPHCGAAVPSALKATRFDSIICGWLRKEVPEIRSVKLGSGMARRENS